MLQSATLKFLKGLKKNNNKPWFEKNKNSYLAAKDDIGQLTGQLLNGLGKTDKSIADLKAKDCQFRIYRDVRFSKDKTPYKTNVSAQIQEGGKKSKSGRGFYFELTPDHVRVYGGIYEIGKEDLLLLREDISQSLPEFKTGRQWHEHTWYRCQNNYYLRG